MGCQNSKPSIVQVITPEEATKKVEALTKELQIRYYIEAGYCLREKDLKMIPKIVQFGNKKNALAHYNLAQIASTKKTLEALKLSLANTQVVIIPET